MNLLRRYLFVSFKTLNLKRFFFEHNNNVYENNQSFRITINYFKRRVEASSFNL